jgi:hypothetical protein
MAFVLDDVGSWGRSGNYLLFPSISHFDPERTSPQGRHDEQRLLGGQFSPDRLDAAPAPRGSGHGDQMQTGLWYLSATKR